MTSMYARLNALLDDLKKSGFIDKHPDAYQTITDAMSHVDTAEVYARIGRRYHDENLRMMLALNELQKRLRASGRRSDECEELRLIEYALIESE